MTEKEFDELFEHLEGAMREASRLSDTLKFLLNMAAVEATECVQRWISEEAQRA